MDKKKDIIRNQVFQGSLNEALHNYLGKDGKALAGDFWHSDAITTAVENADNALKSLRVLQKHLPVQFQPLIRFAQPGTTWYLNVEKGTTATQLNMLADDLLIRIARDIGYAPRLKIAVQPSHQKWRQSGFSIQAPEKQTVELPDKQAAVTFLNDFVKKST